MGSRLKFMYLIPCSACQVCLQVESVSGVADEDNVMGYMVGGVYKKQE